MAPMKLFQDRREAGQGLGERLARLGLGNNLLVFGLAGGGIPVATEVAKCLGVAMEVLLVRRLRAPFRDITVGAVGFGGVTVYNEESLAELRPDARGIAQTRLRELAELGRQERHYRGSRPLPDVTGKTVVLVDDGIDTGATMYAAALAVRALAPGRIIAAVPTSARDSVARLEEVADRVVALVTPQPYGGVAGSYAHFPRPDDLGLNPPLTAAA